MDSGTAADPRPRVALLGGSFNPPHVAHQMVCLWALSTGVAQRVWLMPCNEHAFDKQLLSFEHRCAMCELMGDPFVPGTLEVSRVEGELGGRSRTYDTLVHLQRTHPGLTFSLLIGADILQEKDSWYRFDDLQRLVRVKVLGRGGYPSPGDAPLLPPISSSQIRRRLAAGQEVSALVPAAVLAYIERHGLYRG